MNKYGVTWQHLLSAAEIQTVHELAAEQTNTNQRRQATIEKLDGPDPNVRRSNITWMGNSERTAWLYKKVTDAILEINHDIYGFDLVGTEPFQYTEYTAEDQGFYNWHTDIVETKNQYIRKLSASIVLSDCSDYAGGRFLTRIDGNAREIEQQQGRIIVFPSWVPHCVTPVLRGTRKSLVLWCYGKEFI